MSFPVFAAAAAIIIFLIVLVLRDDYDHFA